RRRPPREAEEPASGAAGRAGSAGPVRARSRRDPRAGHGAGARPRQAGVRRAPARGRRGARGRGAVPPVRAHGPSPARSRAGARRPARAVRARGRGRQLRGRRRGQPGAIRPAVNRAISGTLLFAAVAVLATLVLSWFSYRGVRAALEDSFERRLSNVAGAAASQISPQDIADARALGEEA